MTLRFSGAKSSGAVIRPKSTPIVPIDPTHDSLRPSTDKLILDLCLDESEIANVLGRARRILSNLLGQDFKRGSQTDSQDDVCHDRNNSTFLEASTKTRLTIDTPFNKSFVSKLPSQCCFR